jgi:hypothetical protein
MTLPYRDEIENKEKETKSQERYLFKDPEEYKNLSPEERKKETEIMMKFWKSKPLL